MKQKQKNNKNKYTFLCMQKLKHFYGFGEEESN